MAEKEEPKTLSPEQTIAGTGVAQAEAKKVAPKKIKKVERKSKPKQKKAEKKETKERKHKVDRDKVKNDLKKMGLSEVAKKYKISTTYAWRIKTGRFRDKPRKK